MKNYFIILLIAMVQLNSCQDKKRDMKTPEEKDKIQEEILNRPSNIWPTNKDQNGDYYYNVNMGTMKGYIAQDAGSHFVTDKESVSIPAMMLGENWGEGTGSYVLNYEYHPLPKKLYVAWFSASENKFYEGLFKMPYDKIKDEFDKMWKAYPDKSLYAADRYDRFTDIIVGVAPKGDVVVWLSSLSQKIQIGQYKAKETTAISWEDFAEMSGMGEGNTKENYLKHSIKSISPLPIGKVDRYEQEYTWKPKIEYETNVSGEEINTLKYRIDYFNGELENIYALYNKSNVYKKRFVPQKIIFRFKTDDKSLYGTGFELDEEDIYKAFAVLTKDNELPLELVVKLDREISISKIVLRNERNEYVLDTPKKKISKSFLDLNIEALKEK